VSEAARRIDRDGDRVLVLDVRDQRRFDEGSLPGARLTRLPEVDPLSTEPAFPGYKMIIVYGQNPRSGPALALAKRLMVTDHDNVQYMEEGYDTWVSRGLPTTKHAE